MNNVFKTQENFSQGLFTYNEGKATMKYGRSYLRIKKQSKFKKFNHLKYINGVLYYFY